MRHLERELILSGAMSCDEAIAKEHLKSFVLSFVAENRQERWQHLLLHNFKNAYKKSSKLEACLNKSICSLVRKKWVEEKYELDLIGVYYDFKGYGGNLLIKLNEALILGEFEDAIFSIQGGKLGFYFSHENRIWLCQKQISQTR